MKKYINRFNYNKKIGIGFIKNVFNILSILKKGNELYLYFVIVLALNTYLYSNNMLRNEWIYILFHEYFIFKILEKYFKNEDII